MKHKDLFYGSLFYQLSVPIIIMDETLETVVDVNQSALERLKMKASDVLDRRFKTTTQIDLCGTAATKMPVTELEGPCEYFDPSINIEILGTFTFKGRKYVASMLVTTDAGNQ